jgi:hypothetical protein
MKPAGWVALFVLLACASAFAQSIGVPYRGLDYAMMSKGGVTVMIAPLDLSILHYSAAHVWVTNGSPKPIQLSPLAFLAKARTTKQPQAEEFRGVSDLQVVNAVMQHARFSDILALVRAYERNLYGFKNPEAINYYQERKQMAAAEGTRKLRAGATVSALVLGKGDVPPGEFREGTVFFATNDKKAQFTAFSVQIGALSFLLHPPEPSTQ